MYAETLTPTGANRPEFAPFSGLGRYFPNPTGALLYSIGNALGSVASAVGGFFKEQVGERFSNLVQSRGFRTNDQFYGEVGQMISGLGNGADLYAGGMSAGSRAIKLTPEQRKVVEQLKAWNIATDAFDNKLILDAGVDIDKLGKNISKDAVGLQLLRRHIKEVNGYKNTIDENFNVINKGSDRAALQRWGAYVNGDSDANFITDGDGIFMGANGKMIPLNSPDKIANYVKGLGPNRGPLLLTQNGMATTIKYGVEMMTDTRQVASNSGGFKGSSLMIFNDTGGVLGEDLGKYRAQNEVAQKTIEQLLREQIFKHGDIIVAHSQGGQIVTNAIANNDKKIPVQLLVFGSANMQMPNHLVERMVDFRNYMDYVPGGAGVVSGVEKQQPNATVNNYERYNQVDRQTVMQSWGPAKTTETRHWGPGTPYATNGGGEGHDFSYYLDGLQWYLQNKRGGRF